MSKRKKKFIYEFIDGKQSFNSSTIIKCTKTGEEVKMYHKQLAKLIKNKYKNNYKVFKATYIKKGNNEQVESNELDPAPEGYRQFLIVEYMYLKKKNNISEIERNNRLAIVRDNYFKRYDSDIERSLAFVEEPY